MASLRNNIELLLLLLILLSGSANGAESKPRDEVRPQCIDLTKAVGGALRPRKSLPRTLLPAKSKPKDQGVIE